MSRLLWFAAGAGAGIYALARARRAAEALTPEGLADRLAGLSLGLHLFRDEVRAGMAEKETELRGRLGLTGPQSTTPAVGPGPAPGSTPAVGPAPQATSDPGTRSTPTPRTPSTPTPRTPSTPTPSTPTPSIPREAPH